MGANERRAEIMRILGGRRQETIGRLASELGVTERTIRNDVLVLTVKYPLETVRGNGGCVRLAHGYRTHKIILSQEQQKVLNQMLDKADEYQQKILKEILTLFGSPVIKEKSSNGNPTTPQTC